MLDLEQIEDLRQLDDGRGAVLAKIVGTYLKRAPEHIQLIGACLQEGRLTDLINAAHSFKGSSGNIGAKSIADICFSLEQMGKANDVAGLQNAVAQLQAEFTTTEPALKAQLPVEFR